MFDINAITDVQYGDGYYLTDAEGNETFLTYSGYHGDTSNDDIVPCGVCKRDASKGAVIYSDIDDNFACMDCLDAAYKRLNGYPLHL